jgi:hypothetical protein
MSTYGKIANYLSDRRFSRTVTPTYPTSSDLEKQGKKCGNCHFFFKQICKLKSKKVEHYRICELHRDKEIKDGPSGNLSCQASE